MILCLESYHCLETTLGSEKTGVLKLIWTTGDDQHPCGVVEQDLEHVWTHHLSSAKLSDRPEGGSPNLRNPQPLGCYARSC